MDVRTEKRRRPHQKVRFSAAAVMGRNFLTQGRPGVRIRNVCGKSGPKSLCLCCFFFPELNLAHRKRPALEHRRATAGPQRLMEASPGKRLPCHKRRQHLVVMYLRTRQGRFPSPPEWETSLVCRWRGSPCSLRTFSWSISLKCRQICCAGRWEVGAGVSVEFFGGSECPQQNKPEDFAKNFANELCPDLPPSKTQTFSKTSLCRNRLLSMSLGGSQSALLLVGSAFYTTYSCQDAAPICTTRLLQKHHRQLNRYSPCLLGKFLLGCHLHCWSIWTPQLLESSWTSQIFPELLRSSPVTSPKLDTLRWLANSFSDRILKAPKPDTSEIWKSHFFRVWGVRTYRCIQVFTQLIWNDVMGQFWKYPHWILFAMRYLPSLFVPKAFQSWHLGRSA